MSTIKIKILYFFVNYDNLKNHILKKIVISFLLAFVAFGILGGLFANFIFLPQLALWQEAFPDAVKPAPDFVSGFLVGIIQLVGFIYLMNRLKIDNIKDAALVIVFNADTTEVEFVLPKNQFHWQCVFSTTEMNAAINELNSVTIEPRSVQLFELQV